MENRTKLEVLIKIKAGWSGFVCFFFKVQRYLLDRRIPTSLKEGPSASVSYRQWHMDAKHGLSQKY